jgi:hypothetical protein
VKFYIHKSLFPWSAFENHCFKRIASKKKKKKKTALRPSLSILRCNLLDFKPTLETLKTLKAVLLLSQQVALLLEVHSPVPEM